MQKILHVPKRKREPNINHDSQTDDLWAHLKVAKWAAVCHPTRVRGRTARRKQLCSDSVPFTAVFHASLVIVSDNIFGSAPRIIASEGITACVNGGGTR
jgi:hypothetical protein